MLICFCLLDAALKIHFAQKSEGLVPSLLNGHDASADINVNKENVFPLFL